MRPKPDAALLRRASAALELVKSGALSPSTALFLTCFPTEEVEQASRAPHARSHFTEQQREHALELVAAGFSWARVAETVGCSKGSVGDWVRRATIAGDVPVPASSP